MIFQRGCGISYRAAGTGKVMSGVEDLVSGLAVRAARGATGCRYSAKNHSADGWRHQSHPENGLTRL